jgi:hypothetical protein
LQTKKSAAMNQQPDKLFREKLEGHQKPAPASAWEKIAASQSKKNDKWLWLKIAASISFVAAAAYLSWPEDKPQDLSHASKNTPAEEKTTSAEKSEDVKTEILQPSEASDNSSSNIAKGEKTTSRKVMSKKAIQKTTEEEVTKEEIVPTPVETNELIATVETIDEAPTDETPVAMETEPQNITLVYSAKDVEEYLDKKSLAEATSDNKKSSTLKKLLKKAEDLTNNQDPFGELRQKKNEILALNFKNEKQRGQNK